MPKALALESNPLGRINELRSLLSDRYSRTTVLKEWLQNADDAGARTVLVASVETPPGCTHELLAAGSPAVVVLNNGKFDENDSLAIRQFGLNNKSGDGAAIGKFGLGLKSVFHLCEAFFFLSPKSPADDPDGVFNNLVSPWAGTEYHAHWGDVDAADLDRLRVHLAPACRRLDDRWFALWLPLRRTDYKHVARILNEPYAGPPADLLSPPDAIHLAPAAALLKQLSRVELWDGMPAEGTSPRRQWTLLPTGNRSNYPQWTTLEASPATTREIGTGRCFDGSVEASYALVEAWRNEDWAKAARGRPEWPTRYDLQGNSQPDKARPHAAVVLTRRRGREDGKLHDSPAVFLPLSAGANVHKPEDAEFLLLRHGCFFVDSGRGGVYAGDGVRGEWNSELMRDGVLPLIVPAVDKLAEVCDEAAKRRLTAAVQNWMKADEREHVCRDGGWAQRWRAGGARWETIPNGARVLEIPAFPEHGLPARVLPGLAGSADDYALVPATEPRLLAREPEPWQDELLGLVLAVPEAQPLLDGDALDYLVEFVSRNRRQFGASARHALAGTLRRVFAAASNRELTEHNDRLVRLVGEVPPGCRRRLSLGGNWPASTRQTICRVEADILIVPDVLEVSAGEGVFDMQHAVNVLRLLAADMSVGRNTNPAAEVIDVSVDPTAVCAATADLVLWQVQCPEPHGKRDQTELRSRNQLNTACGSGTLFGGEAKEELKELAAAVAVRLIVLNGETAKSLLLDPLPEVSAAGITEVLMKKPDLHPAEARLPLILQLMAATGDESFRTRRRLAVRYLLHADKELHARDDLYLPAAGAEVIGKVAQAVLERQGSAGRLLQTGTLTVSLNDQQRSELGLVKLDWDGLARLLSGQQTAPDVSFDDAEQDQLLDGLRNYRHVIRLLPLHDRADGGGRVPLTDGCYWQTQETVDTGSLSAKLTLLKPHSKTTYAAIQQDAGGKEFTNRTVVDLAIQHGAAKHWQTLLTAMAMVGTLSREQSDSLKTSLWLLLEDGRYVAPNQVLYDEQLDDVIADAVKRVPVTVGDSVPQAKLDARVRNHDGFKALSRLFPDRGQTLLKLGGLLGREPQFHVGKIDDMDAWCEAFRVAPSDIMAATALVAKAHEVAPEECKSRLLPNLDKSPPADRIEKILEHLRAKHEQMTGPRTRLQRIHDAYLKQAAALPRFDEILPRLLLLNSTDPPRWTRAETLCAGVSGIDPVRTLDANQDAVLGNAVSRLPKRELAAGTVSGPAMVSAADEAFNESVKRLWEYFAGWKQSELLSAWAGAFLSLLGDYEPIRKLAAEFLPHGHAPEFVRSRAVTGNHSLRTSSQRVLVQVTDTGKKVQVVNLLGKGLEVDAVTALRTLLIGYGLDRVEHRLADRSLKVNCLDLRVADPNTVAEFPKALAETGNLILRVYYGVPEKDVRFEDALDSFRGDDEYGLQFAQVMFLNEGGNAFRNRGVSHPDIPALRELLQRYKEAEQREGQETIAEQGGGTVRLPGDSARKLTSVARDELRRLIETSAQVQAAFLAGVRQRLDDAGYTARSVLFELFQNADDAYIEKRDPSEGQVPWFRFDSDHSGPSISHDGRTINRPRPDDAYDLRKMLALHHSEKGTDGQQVTGKFGLGFKSVFLVCDEPRIVSGRLAVRVVGGSYPLPLPPDEAKSLRERLPTETSTLFRLPREEAVWAEDFRRLSHLLPVFARRIRKVQIDGRPHTWAEREVVATPSARVVVGHLNTQADPQKAVVVRCGEHGDVLFGLNDDGFAAMPADVPSVWVTAPTAEEHRLGYVVNARELPIDIGRSQVAWTHPDAGRVLRGLATVLGEALVELFDAGVAWLDESANAQSVWRSFWEVVKTKGERGELREGLMWGPHGAARWLFTERKTLPTGLTAAVYAAPTSLADVKGTVSGLMDRHPNIFVQVAEWDSFQQAYPPGSLVLFSAVGQHLAESPQAVTLVSAVELELRTVRVDPRRASSLGHAITRERLSSWQDRWGEVERIRELLRTAEFCNATDQFVAASHLITGDAGGDEARRAAFAPPQNLLSPDYKATAVDFFLACREQMSANAETLLEWVLQAKPGNKQMAALRYLGQGDLGQPLLRLVRENRHRWPEWLRKLTLEQLREAGLDEFSAGQVAAAISPPVPTPQQPFVPPQAPPPPARAAEVLARIAAWWDQNRDGELGRYYARIYPDGRRPDVTADGSLGDDAVRGEWLKLLVAGSLQTLGRVKAQQNREFLRIAERRNWLEMLADPTDGPSTWLADVQRYVDAPRYHADTIRYFHWLRQFVSFDTIARHLTTYAEAFLSIDRFRGAFAPSDVFAVRTSRQFQGTGLDAPPMLPFLGIGACFVLRELARSHVVTRPEPFPFCYAPARRLRVRLQRLGWVDPATTPADRSRAIHGFLSEHLEDPTFGGDFDIPLLVWPDWDTVPSQRRTSVDGDFVTLGDGRVIPRSYMS